MKQILALLVGGFAASPALAASGPFVSLGNTNFVVLIAFVLFIALLLFLKVPGVVAKMLDQRAETISSELDEARALREEAQTLLASYERKQREVQEQADRIVTHAKAEAAEAAEQAKADLKEAIARRLRAAEDQIASAEAGAVKEVRDRAISVAVAAAKDVIAQSLSAADGKKLVEESIETVGAKLH